VTVFSKSLNTVVLLAMANMAAPAKQDESTSAPSSNVAVTVTPQIAATTVTRATSSNLADRGIALNNACALTRISEPLIPSDEKHAEVPVGDNTWRRKNFYTSSSEAGNTESLPCSFVKLIDIGSAETKQQFQVPLLIEVSLQRRPVIVAVLMTELVPELNGQLKHAGVQLRKMCTRAKRLGARNPKYMLSFDELESVAPGSVARVLDEVLQWMNLYWLQEHIQSFQQDGYLQFNLGSWVQSGNPLMKIFLHEKLFSTVCQHVFHWTPSPLQVGHEALTLGKLRKQTLYGVPCQAYSLEYLRLVLPSSVHGLLSNQLKSLLNELNRMKEDKNFDGGCCITFLPIQRLSSSSDSDSIASPVSTGLCACLGLPSENPPPPERNVAAHAGMDGAVTKVVGADGFSAKYSIYLSRVEQLRAMCPFAVGTQGRDQEHAQAIQVCR